MSLAEDALGDTFRVGLGFVIARLIRGGLLTPDMVRADLQAAAAALLTHGEPGAPPIVRTPVDESDLGAYQREVLGAVPWLAGAVLAALAMAPPDAPVAPPDPVPATVADLAGFAPWPYVRVRVTRAGEDVGVLTLLPGGWAWRGTARWNAGATLGNADPVAAALAGGAVEGDAVGLVYPVVPGPG